LFGLDQLRKHRSCIDLEKNCLRILGQEIQFLAEKDLPRSARGNHHEDDIASTSNSHAPHAAISSSSSSSSSSSRSSLLSSIPTASSSSPSRTAPTSPLPPAQPRHSAVSSLQPSTLGTAQPFASVLQSAQPTPASIAPVVPGPASQQPETTSGGASGNDRSIRTLMELGFQRGEVIRALTLHNGNEELAASFLFNQQFGL